MVVLVDEDGAGAGEGRRRFRPAPPIANSIGGKEYNPQAVVDKRERERTNIDRLLSSREETHAKQADELGARRSQTSTSATSSRGRPHSQQHSATMDRKGTASVLGVRGGANESEISFQLKG